MRVFMSSSVHCPLATANDMLNSSCFMSPIVLCHQLYYVINYYSYPMNLFKLVQCPSSVHCLLATANVMLNSSFGLKYLSIGPYIG